MLSHVSVLFNLLAFLKICISGLKADQHLIGEAPHPKGRRFPER
jgi:hypothetical protein